MGSYWIFKAVSRAACLLPRRFCDRLGRMIGALVWLLIPARRKRLARRQIMDCLAATEQEAERIARQVRSASVRCCLRFCAFPLSAAR